MKALEYVSHTGRVERGRSNSIGVGDYCNSSNKYRISRCVKTAVRSVGSGSVELDCKSNVMLTVQCNVRLKPKIGN